MPCISDPGEPLVQLCHKLGVPMEVVPGPSAAIAALAVSGQHTARFAFEGFLSVNRNQRTAHLEQLRQEYPALQDPAGSTPEAIVEGVAEMKRLLKYNDNTIADKLGLGRTTLWRMQKKSGAAKAKKEE